ncbi:Ltp family lipoprotein [Acinetobacter bereziniae]|nr:Ltp family lipoprotein [Acinetobacter bereziniae]
MIVSLIIVGATIPDEDKARYATQNQTSETQAVPANQQQTNAQEPIAQPQPEQVEQTQEAVEPKISLTNPQKNAVRSAEQYLTISGFSRDGLINQLSADAGDGYNKADATVAVDSLDVDWNEQAVKSAKQYLEIQGFSCNGLIQQLSSSAGDKYTKTQAKYGAKQAGAC